MGQDLGVVLLPEPVIVVLAPVAVDDVDLRDLPGDGRGKHYRRRGSGMLTHGIFRTSLSQDARLGRRGPSPATSCGSHFTGRSPRTAGPQPRDVLRLTLHRTLASDGGAPAPRRPAAHTSPDARLGRRGPSPATSCGSHFTGRSPRTAGPQ